METRQGIDVNPIWNLMTCLFYECCDKKEEREKTLILGKCMYNPSVFKCEEFQKRSKGVVYDLDYL
ncbi:MAG TPA: hypothetical protein ENG87_03640 [Candidatus Pacearchaeota archaeon]|nr:hypothetical protein BMS3Abin17_01382 [archaeon BMS3Abin17]HDK42445.1 hypothetical protein [Candidatus Pacearchaeota archaeon]HDZ61055.1 hypothetical protein [Candidatus Pacearchaeota archaeon]